MAAPALSFLQNTPNPFNPETVFRFGLPERAEVGFQVYDLAGRHVRTLMDGAELDPGWHEVLWDGRSDRGETVATGVYFCRLTVGSRKLSRKVVVLKSEVRYEDQQRNRERKTEVVRVRFIMRGSAWVPAGAVPMEGGGLASACSGRTRGA
jgi:hypothetical protein